MAIRLSDKILAAVSGRVRGYCTKCGERKWSFGIRMYRPNIGRQRICYRCLAEYFIYLNKRRKKNASKD